MGIILNSKERLKVIDESRIGEGVDYVMKAQALKVLDELEKPCPHETYANLKRECVDCMTEIRMELQDVSQT